MVHVLCIAERLQQSRIRIRSLEFSLPSSVDINSLLGSMDIQLVNKHSFSIFLWWGHDNGDVLEAIFGGVYTLWTGNVR